MSDGANVPPERATTVVVVDDHPMIVDMMVTIIEAMPGFSAVGRGSTAAEGLAAMLAHRPDVVVVDYVLPDGQGSDLARGILRLAPDTKVVMITGASTSRALVDALGAGCHGFLDKSRAPAELVRVLTSVAAGAADFPDDVLAELPRMDQLVVHYQPIVDLQSESAVGAEALVRWGHPERGLLAPAAFIPQAEETGLVIPSGGGSWPRRAGRPPSGTAHCPTPAPCPSRSTCPPSSWASPTSWSGWPTPLTPALFRPIGWCWSSPRPA